MTRHILHCDINSFYASVEMQRHPELRSKPLAVCGSQEERQLYCETPRRENRHGHLAGQAVLPGACHSPAGHG